MGHVKTAIHQNLATGPQVEFLNWSVGRFFFKAPQKYNILVHFPLFSKKVKQLNLTKIGCNPNPFFFFLKFIFRDGSVAELRTTYTLSPSVSAV